MKTKYWFQEPYVWLVILFPAIAVIGGIITLFLALNTDDGLVVDDYYQQGLAINLTLGREQVAATHDLKADIVLLPDENTLRVVISASGKFTYPDNIQVSFFHATRKGFDQIIPLVNVINSSYEGVMPKLVPGTWHVQIESEDWRLLDTLVFP